METRSMKFGAFIWLEKLEMDIVVNCLTVSLKLWRNKDYLPTTVGCHTFLRISAQIILDTIHKTCICILPKGSSSGATTR